MTMSKHAATRRETEMPEPDPRYEIVVTGEATGLVPVGGGKERPITVIGTEAIRRTFGDRTIQQALNMRSSPGVTEVVLNPDAHVGYGAPIGCVAVSPTHIYPGPVGVDIKCSMSLLALDLPEEAVADKKTRRALIEAISHRTPTGPGQGQRQAKKGRRISRELGVRAVTQGASAKVLGELGVPLEWAARCEDAFHVGHDNTREALEARLDRILAMGELRLAQNFEAKANQLGTYGGGNHFGECEIVRLRETEEAKRAASAFGLVDGQVAFLSHCGSRGIGAMLADLQFKTLQRKFARWNIPLPGNDKELVYAPLGSQEADDYIDDMSLGANFATVNHMLINALVLEAFREVIPGTTGRLVYFISHNIARLESTNMQGSSQAWVHRKGATRAFPAGHPGLRGTLFESVGHPILLPGNPQAGSSVMVARPGASLSCYSVNHGAGRRLSRTAASKTLDQKLIDQSFADRDILTNTRNYPIDEAPDAYKDFEEVMRSVELAGLAGEVARLNARFVIKDGDKADD